MSSQTEVEKTRLVESGEENQRSKVSWRRYLERYDHLVSGVRPELTKDEAGILCCICNGLMCIDKMSMQSQLLCELEPDEVAEFRADELAAMLGPDYRHDCEQLWKRVGEMSELECHSLMASVEAFWRQPNEPGRMEACFNIGEGTR